MNVLEHPGVDVLRESFSEDIKSMLGDIEAHVNKYSLMDAIREGSTVTDQCQTGWYNDAGGLCALSAAIVAAEARGL